MSSRVAAGLSTVMVSVAMVASAQAGDAPQYDAPIEEVLPAPLEVASRSGWYLRGDIGYSKQNDVDVSFGPVLETSGDWDDTWLVGVGLGYRFNDYLRTDFTGEYRLSSDITFSDSIGAVQVGGIDSTVLLANVYYDIKKFGAFTPYLGVGIGGTYNRVDRIYEGNPPPVFDVGENNWAWAAAAMAGVSYDATQNLKLDANYRYLWLDKAQTSFESDYGTNEFRFRYEDLSAHEFRIGARYEFGNSAY